ncbi:MAG: rod shape-determining protein [Thermotogaceae bacterium]|nr:rod shape-determining protein [Thermotogaceae bacterium]
MAKGDLGIDLGTASFIVYQKGKGIVLYEPSVVTVSRKTGEIIAVGEDARKMIGKTHKDLVAIKPMKDGVIANYKVIEAVLREFFKRTIGKFKFFKPEVVIGVPTKITSVEKRAVFEASISAGARKVHIVSEPLAAAIGAGIDVTKSEGSMVIDIGGGTTDIAVISLGGIVVGDSIKVAGTTMDEAIVKYVKKKYGLVIGETTAEEIKKNIGKVHPDYDTFEMEIRGRDAVSGLPRTDVINSDDVMEAIRPAINTIVTKLKAILEITPPELASDIIENGIILTGGGSLIRGIDRAIEEEIGVKAMTTEDPIMSVAKGTGILLDDKQLLQTVAETYER